ncbi:DNA polymerase IV [Microaerobacter geothermalis]|uniref:DNA polymerase IV n=1 Tax=Microaerobacter geothermalis TaxID=674972 RepID=UPI001F22E7B6|nr:DNA polymerase IV [Microaerobacter geothermalis]MCF6092782.1 DNA polymerase IV [Microaerobacter geothermalis]
MGKQQRVIFLSDMQSFYASVEKSANPSLMDKPLVVSGDPERRSGIILAACPLAKKWGVKTAEPLWKAQQKCPDLVVVKPRMRRYLDVSLQITSILYNFTDLVEPYSIDEQFMDVTHSINLFGTPEEMAEKIQRKIQKETGIWARIGISENKVLAKMACDHFAKKENRGIHFLPREDMEKRLWPLPVNKLFGVGTRMGNRLYKLGIRTIGDLAKTPLERLKHLWGINGHILWMTANGIDHSPVSPGTYNGRKSIGHHMTLPRDYHRWEEIKVVLLELSEEVCYRARTNGYMGLTVTVACRGADFDHPTGFSRQDKLEELTHSTMEVYHLACKIFLQHWDHQPIRSIGITLSSLSKDDGYQLHLFKNQEKVRKLGFTMDMIKHRFGKSAIVRASSLTTGGQAMDRAKKIGGHHI